MSAFRNAITMRFQALPAFRPAGVASSRSFQSCRVLAAGKESKEGNAERAQEIENSKQQQLKDQKSGQNKWADNLASDSESAVKADRGEHGGNSQSISDLQKESAKAAEKEKR